MNKNRRRWIAALIAGTILGVGLAPASSEAANVFGITGHDVKNGSLRGRDVRDGTIRPRDLGPGLRARIHYLEHSNLQVRLVAITYCRETSSLHHATPEACDFLMP